jgi:hypothetical protein
MLIAAQRLGRDQGWNTLIVTAVSVAVLGASLALLQAAFKVSAKQREAEGSMF